MFSRAETLRALRACLMAEAEAAADGANATLVTITVKDGTGTVVPCPVFDIILSDAATGLDITGTTASGNVTDKTAGTTGRILATLVAKKALRVQGIVDGTYKLSITDTGKTAFVVCATLGGVTTPVITLAGTDYGS